MEFLAETPRPLYSCVTAVAPEAVALTRAGTAASTQSTLWTFTMVSLCPPLPLFTHFCVNPGVTAKLTGCCTDPEGNNHSSIHTANILRVLIVSSNILLEVTAKLGCQYHSSTNATRNATVYYVCLHQPKQAFYEQTVDPKNVS